ncbi:hypothetical protein DCAR_0521191 [Daucus carota subsp. sativus]|uniref:Uncharacterized protein n=1 Tax=Daucus carota subsp. sativus TaxID=79200 RepID=A0AAF1B3F9_DAUCS|nr:hypothetical protein DCAR_0521191 [Daucus carota subsp. sativus]
MFSNIALRFIHQFIHCIAGPKPSDLYGRRVAQLRIHPVKLRRYSIRSGPSRASAAPGTGMPTNPFNFSVVAGLLNDPSVKELAEQIAQDPSFNQIAEQLKKSFEGARAGDGIPQVDPQQYFSSVQQVMQNPQLMTMAERLGSALMQDPSMSQILESLNNPAQQDQLQERIWNDEVINVSLLNFTFFVMYCHDFGCSSGYVFKFLGFS